MRSKQCRDNAATLCCAKTRRYELSRVTSPLNQESRQVLKVVQLVENERRDSSAKSLDFTDVGIVAGAGRGGGGGGGVRTLPGET